MNKPTVSFVVPCYKLAHFLPECLNSILRQTYPDFEILIMDDRSPDNTEDVARSFDDPRIRYILNETNLGHLRNYNKGICLSEGRYVWLISADDYLREPDALQKYVELLDARPHVGYVFCPGFGVRDGKEVRVLGRYSSRWDRNRIFSSHQLLKKLLRSNLVLTPSGLVRRECYETISMFELDMPWCGDWYLWCLFALHYDVAYLAEPMVCYREHHDLSMTSQLTTEKLDACAAEEIAVPWKIREAAERAGNFHVAELCLPAAARTYGRTIASERYRNATSFMNLEMFEASLLKYATRERDREYVRALVWSCIANEYYWQGDLALAKKFFRLALRANHWMLTAWIKVVLLSTGTPGDRLRKALIAWR